MAGGSEGGEKTEKPTPKKLQDAAKKGDILQSRELGTALVVMAGIGCLAVIGPSLIDALRDMLVEALRIRREDIVDFSPAKRGLDLLASIALPVAGVMLATFLAAIDSGTVDKHTVGLEIQRKLLLHNNKSITELVHKHFGQVSGATTQQMQKRIEELNSMLLSAQRAHPDDQQVSTAVYHLGVMGQNDAGDS